MPREINKDLAYDGSGKRRLINPKPKDWASVRPSEGRTGKSKRAKEVKLRLVLMPGYSLMEKLLEIKATHIQSRWLLTFMEPKRTPTSEDILYILYSLRNENINTMFEVEYSDKSRVLNIRESVRHMLP